MLLLVLSLRLIRLPHRAEPSADLNPVAIANAGILQLTWLLGSEPHISAVRRPELDLLREAGLFEVNMANKMRGEDLEEICAHGCN